MMLGSLGYIIIEGWDPLQAIWMTIITMSTVGYGEVAPLSGAGRILTIFIIISSLIVVGYTVGRLSAFLIGGEIGKILKGKRLERNIERLSGHVILVGFGAVGTEAAHWLSNPNLLVIEKDQDRFDEAQEQGYYTLLGDATQDDILIQAKAKSAKGLVIAIGHVADTVLIAITARELNPDIIISARVDDPHGVSKLRRVGVNSVVQPSQIGGRRLASYLEKPTTVDFLDLVMHRDELSLKLEEIPVVSGCGLEGKTLAKSDIRKASGGALVMSIYTPDGGHVIAPSADYSIRSGDVLITLGTDTTLKKVCEMARK